MNEYQEALDRLKTIVENYGEHTVVESNGQRSTYNKCLNSYKVAKEDVDTLQDCVDRLADYEDMEEKFEGRLENIMTLFQVCKNERYYFMYKDKIYECNNVYINGIYWDKQNGAYISVSTSNELREKYEIYDVRLFAKDIGITWFI